MRRECENIPVIYYFANNLNPLTMKLISELKQAVNFEFSNTLYIRVAY